MKQVLVAKGQAQDRSWGRIYGLLSPYCVPKLGAYFTDMIPFNSFNILKMRDGGWER